MFMNQIQFQHGLSLPEFLAEYGTEAQCAQALERTRWPEGFQCPRCHESRYTRVQVRGHTLFQCSACRHQASLLTGTVMQWSKLPLTVWFLVIYLVSQAKTGLSALALKRHLGVSYPTAWLIHIKLMQAMAVREDGYQIEGQVQIDDAYLGGERSGGKAGRRSENKVPFVAAVSMNEEGHPPPAGEIHAGVRLHPECHYSVGQRESGVRQYCIFGWACLLHCGTHQPTVVGGRKPKNLSEFKWINTVLGNLKTRLSGIDHAFHFRRYAEHYLAAFTYRFSRRFNLRTLTA